MGCRSCEKLPVTQNLIGSHPWSQPPPSHADHRGVTFRRFLFFAVPIGVAIVWRAVTLKWGILWRDGLFFSPYHVLGSAYFPITVILLLLIPILLCTTIVLLARISPRPVSAGLVVSCLGLSIVQFLLALPHVTDFYEFSNVMSPLMIVIAVLTPLEIARREIKNHTTTMYLTVAMALAFWVVASSLVAAIEASI